MAKDKKRNDKGQFQKGHKEGGRPQIEVDWKTVDTLLGVACTGEEIAAAMDISYDTISRRCEEKFEIPFAEYAKKKMKGTFNVSLRSAQYRAIQGEKKVVTIERYVNGPNGEPIREVITTEQYVRKVSDSMLIWLGKQYLGQTDKQEVSGKDGSPLGLDWSQVPLETRAQMLRLLKQAKKKNAKG